jgi:hypothetical protein
MALETTFHHHHVPGYVIAAGNRERTWRNPAHFFHLSSRKGKKRRDPDSELGAMAITRSFCAAEMGTGLFVSPVPTSLLV